MRLSDKTFKLIILFHKYLELVLLYSNLINNIFTKVSNLSIPTFELTWIKLLIKFLILSQQLFNRNAYPIAFWDNVLIYRIFEFLQSL